MCAITTRMPVMSSTLWIVSKVIKFLMLIIMFYSFYFSLGVARQMQSTLLAETPKSLSPVDST